MYSNSTKKNEFKRSLTSPSSTGKNSLKVICWMMAAIARRVSKNKVVSSQKGLREYSLPAMRLCSDRRAL